MPTLNNKVTLCYYSATELGCRKIMILHNPNNHMYFFGVKFASLNVVKDMKISRNEEKDKIDVGLINNLC